MPSRRKSCAMVVYAHQLTHYDCPNSPLTDASLSNSDFGWEILETPMLCALLDLADGFGHRLSSLTILPLTRQELDGYTDDCPARFVLRLEVVSVLNSLSLKF